MNSNVATIFRSTNGRFIHVRAPYNDGFAAAARGCRRAGAAEWDREQRTWRFDTVVPGITQEYVEQLCRTHYGAAQAVSGGTAPSTQQTPDAGHVGKQGDKLRDLLLQVTKAIDLEPGAYGPARLHILRDLAGHVFTWRASNERLNVGEIVSLNGTVKRLDEYRGVSQTVLTRCKVTAKHGSQPVTAQPFTQVVPAWFEMPWACGHKDPVYVGPHKQRCAVCAAERFEPGFEPQQELPEVDDAEHFDVPPPVMTLADEVGF